jgi:hypothetical protein
MISSETPLGWRIALLGTPEDHVRLLQDLLGKEQDDDPLLVASVLWACYYRHTPSHSLSQLFPSSWAFSKDRHTPAHLVALPLTSTEQDEALGHIKSGLEKMEGSRGIRGPARAAARQLLKDALHRAEYVAQEGLTQFALTPLAIPQS